jgi:hypothetical protein
MTQLQTIAGASESVDHLDADLIDALAALRGAPLGVAELAFQALSAGTRGVLTASGFAEESADGSMTITGNGRAAIDEAARRVPEPYEDISLEELSSATREALEELIAETDGVRIRDPEAHYATMGRPASRIRQMGRSAAARVATLSHGHGRHDDHSGSDSAAGV